MDQLGISAIHPTAPEFLSVTALYTAPIDVEAALGRLESVWSEKDLNPQWSEVPSDPNNPTAPTGRILHFMLDGIQVMLTPVNNVLTPEKGELPRHRFYVAMTFYVTDANQVPESDDDIPQLDALAMHRRHRMVAAHVVMTEVADSLMRDEAAAVGIFRSELGVVLPAEMFTRIAKMLTMGRAPVPLWINTRVHQPQLTYGRTLGLPNFGHLDLEVRDSTRDGDTVYNMLSDLANYVITGNAYLLPTQTIEYQDEKELALSQEITEQGDQVIRIDY